MTKLSSKMHLLIIITTVLIVIGMAVGTVCHFVAGGFFNYGSEFSDYKSIEVSYSLAEQTKSEVSDVCDKALDGLACAEQPTFSESGTYGKAVYKFSAKTDTAKLQSAVDKINTELNSSGYGLSVASYHSANTFAGGARVIKFAAIAIASCVVFQALYFAVRYKLGLAVTSLINNLATIGAFAALLAITRIPVGIEVVALFALTVALSMIASCILCDRIRKNLKADDAAKNTAAEITDASAAESFKIIAVLHLAMVIIIALLAIFTTISAMSAAALAPYGVALLGVIASWYGVSFLTPALYPAFNKLIDSRIKFGKKKSKS